MIELRTYEDLKVNRDKIVELPIEVQWQIGEVLEELDEAYGTGEVREYEGSKVVVLENGSDVKFIDNEYDLSMNEFVNVIETIKENYIYTVIISGAETNVAIFCREEWIREYL